MNVKDKIREAKRLALRFIFPYTYSSNGVIVSFQCASVKRSGLVIVPYTKIVNMQEYKGKVAVDVEQKYVCRI